MDRIAAEDTRHSLNLLRSLGINKPVTALHSHNEHTKSPMIIHDIENGLSYALISDAGTPLISDPGFSLVTQARAKAIRVIPIPGACAFVTALSAAGCPCDQFLFAGFLSHKASIRLQQLQQLANKKITVILYESPHLLQPLQSLLPHLLAAQR